MTFKTDTRLTIDQYQRDQRDHVLYPVRVVARYWGHGGYDWYANTDDDELLCAACVRANYRQIVGSTVRQSHNRWPADGWGIVGFTNSGELEDLELCAHCGTVLFDPAD